MCCGKGQWPFNIQNPWRLRSSKLWMVPNPSSLITNEKNRPNLTVIYNAFFIKKVLILLECCLKWSEEGNKHVYWGWWEQCADKVLCFWLLTKYIDTRIPNCGPYLLVASTTGHLRIARPARQEGGTKWTMTSITLKLTWWTQPAPNMVFDLSEWCHVKDKVKRERCLIGNVSAIPPSRAKLVIVIPCMQHTMLMYHDILSTC